MKRPVVAICVLCLAAAAPAAIPGFSAIEPLPNLSGTTSVGQDINVHGEVAGYAADGVSRGFLWLPADNYGGTAGIYDLPTAVDGGLDTGARGINDNGRVSGYSVRPAGTEMRFSTWELSGGAAPWNDHGEGNGYKISNGGIMAARSAKGTYGFAVTTEVDGAYPSTQYDFLGGESSGYIHRQGTDINNSDQTIAGHRADTNDAVVWTYDADASVGSRYEQETILDKGDGGTARAHGINDAADMVGYVDSDAAYWSVGSYDSVLLLSSLGGDSIAHDVSGAGVIVGTSDGKAAVWDFGGDVVDLDAVFPDVTLTEAVAINENGLILANGPDGAYVVTTTEIALVMGDADRDTDVDDDDLSLLLANWGTGTSWGQGDFKDDDTVNDDDLSLLLANWTGSVAAVPEPATLGLLVLFGLVFPRRSNAQPSH